MPNLFVRLFNMLGKPSSDTLHLIRQQEAREKIPRARAKVSGLIKGLKKELQEYQGRNSQDAQEFHRASSLSNRCSFDHWIAVVENIKEMLTYISQLTADILSENERGEIQEFTESTKRSVNNLEIKVLKILDAPPTYREAVLLPPPPAYKEVVLKCRKKARRKPSIEVTRL